MYDVKRHESLGAKTISSAGIIISLMQEFLDLGSVLDVGCGHGHWLATFEKLGTSNIVGIDGSWTKPEHLLFDKSRFYAKSLDETFDLGMRFSLAISLEVAEHVEPQAAEVFVANLVRHGDIVLFGAAVPFQGGFRHINERWQSYWAALFQQHGYAVFDPVRSQIWDNADVHVWYKQNALLYVNTANHSAVQRVQRYINEHRIQQLPLNVVHPERYEELANYDVILPKLLLRQVANKLRQKLRDRLLFAGNSRQVQQVSGRGTISGHAVAGNGQHGADEIIETPA